MRDPLLTITHVHDRSAHPGFRDRQRFSGSTMCCLGSTQRRRTGSVDSDIRVEINKIRGAKGWLGVWCHRRYEEPMKAWNFRSLSMLGAAVLCFAATACGGAGPNGASRSPGGVTTTETVTAYGVIKPRQFTYTGDSTGMVKDVDWSSWGDDPAAGTGELWINDCVPICARGSWIDRGRVSFTLSAISSGRYGEFRITSRVPAGYRTEFPIALG
jgi:hypothetical protein